MIEIILIILVIVLLAIVVGLFFHVNNLNTATKDFVIEKINDLITKINESKLYEFNYNKKKDDYIKKLDQQVRSVSSAISSNS
jgi:predicted PurR-regulated permease PerM